MHTLFYLALLVHAALGAQETSSASKAAPYEAPVMIWSVTAVCAIIGLVVYLSFYYDPDKHPRKLD